MRRLILLPLLLLATPARAEEDAGLWTAFQINAPVAGRLLVQADLSVRASDRARGLSQIDMALLLGTPVGRGFVLHGGYVRALGYTPDRPTPVEERVRVQLAGPLATVGGGALTLRLRGEVRRRNDAADTAWRGRAQIKWTRPFATGSRTALVLAHETYVNFNRADWVASSGVDRVRNSIGVATPFAGKVRVEVSYLNQHRFVRRGPDRSEHVLQAAFSLRL